MNVCLSTANTLAYPQGGHLWVFINWALGLRACGCNVVWLDVMPPETLVDEVGRKYRVLREALRPFGLDGAIAVDRFGDDDLTPALQDAGLPTLEDRANCELLVDLRYDLPRRLVRRHRRSVLVDLDPGQLQLALAQGKYAPALHDVFFSIGESTGSNGVASDKAWLHTPPCVALDQWPVVAGEPGQPWTTVAHWWGGWMTDDEGNAFPDAKRDGFLPYLDVPSKVSARFELALNLGDAPAEKEMIESHGFKVVDAHGVAGSPLDYRRFIQRSAGEFSCAKPSYVQLRTAWLSDRTVCYLASGKPCVVQSTGPSKVLPDDGMGLQRFTDFSGAVAGVERVLRDYPAHARAARALAEELFDAKRVVTRVLTVALG